MEQFLVFLQKSPMNMLLFGAAVASGGMLLWPLLTRPFRGAQEVGAYEAVQLINREDAAIIDIRSESEFAGGHIANSRNIPQAKLEERMKDVEKLKGRPIVVVCSTGTRAHGVVATLRKQGFEKVHALSGGLAAWQQASMPLEK